MTSIDRRSATCCTSRAATGLIGAHRRPGEVEVRGGGALGAAKKVAEGVLGLQPNARLQITKKG
jgi:hypothetical protein